MALHFLNPETEQAFANPDKLLYRVMPLDRVIEILEKKKWAFVSPTLWNDPFEKAFLEAEYRHRQGPFFLPIRPKKENDEMHYRLFSVCFTETSESEAFWKTYAPNGDGVRLTVKASVLKNTLEKVKDYDVYIGKAVYEDYDTLYSFKTDRKLWKLLQSPDINDAHLKLMLKKRLPFAYENEIRIMLLRKQPMTKSVAKVSIPNTKVLIHAVKLEPRMGTHMARMVKEELYRKGFSAEAVKKSGLYSKPKSCITFKKDIDI